MKSTATKQIASKSEQLYLGIDGGGTKCQARLMSADQSVIGIGISDRANPLHGLEITISSITEATTLALQDAGLNADNINQIIAGVGLAGVNLPNLYTLVSEWQHPFAQMFLTTDLHIACLGAHDYQDGSVIIAGTGSCGVSLRDGKTQVFGAHGFPLGDQSSGAWYGLKAINAILLDYDKLGPATTLRDAVCKQLDVTCSSIAERMSNQPPKEFARLAPLVFSCASDNDDVAIQIIKRGADYINSLANAILNINPNRLSLLGGLREQLTPWLDKSIRDQLADPIHSPEEGAIAFAQHKSI